MLPNTSGCVEAASNPEIGKTMIIALFGVRGSGKDTIGGLLAKNHGFIHESFAKPLKQMVKIAYPDFTDNDLYGPSSGRERLYPQYPFSGPCLSCGGRIRPLKHSVELICVSCKATYPPYLNPRISLQTLGTEWGRRLYKNTWIDGCFERIATDKAVRDSTYSGSGSPSLPSPTNYVITDGRFYNELLRCKELGAYCVKLTRNPHAEAPTPTGFRRWLSWFSRTTTHASEAEFRVIPDSEYSAVLNNAGLGLEELPDAVNHLLHSLE